MLFEKKECYFREWYLLEGKNGIVAQINSSIFFNRVVFSTIFSGTPGLIVFGQKEWYDNLKKFISYIINDFSGDVPDNTLIYKVTISNNDALITRITASSTEGDLPVLCEEFNDPDGTLGRHFNICPLFDSLTTCKVCEAGTLDCCELE